MTNSLPAKTQQLRPTLSLGGTEKPRHAEPQRAVPTPGIVIGRRRKIAAPTRIGFALSTPSSSGDDQSLDDLITIPGEGIAVVLGATGSGKSSGAFVPTILSYPGSVVVVDPKGGLASITSRRRKEFGPIHIVDPFGIGAETCDGLNPLDLFDFATGDEFDLATEISSSGCRNLSAADPFWDVAARSLIARLILLVGAHLPWCRARSIAAVRSLARITGSDLGEILAYTWMSPVAQGELRSLLRCFDLAPPTLTSLLATTEAQLVAFGGGQVDRPLTRSTIDLQRFMLGAPTTV